MPEVGPVLPAPDALTSFFWEAAWRGELAIQRCRSCGMFQHPPEPVCHHCLSFDLGHDVVSGEGTVYSFELATQAFHPWFADKLPFCIAVVELVEQPNLKLVTNIVDTPYEDIRVDAPVHVTFVPLGDRFRLPVFELTRT